MNKKNKIIITVVSIVLVSIVVLSVYVGRVVDLENAAVYNNAEAVPYLQFIERMENGEVDSAHIDFTKDKFYFFTEDHTYETENPNYENFKKDLLDHNVDVVTLTDSTVNMAVIGAIVQTLLIIAVMVYLLKKMSPSFGDKKSAAIDTKPDIKFSDIAGLDESKEDIEHLVKFLKKPKAYTKAGAKLPKGIVLYGPPGTGKTLTAKAIAGEANVPFLSVSGSDFVEMYVGLGAKRVRKLFKEAREKAPCIIFIDEIDALGSKREYTPGSSESNQTINALLAEMDGFGTKDGIIVIAATNRLQDLDSALVRPGRFDRHVAINLPDVVGRRSILKLHTANKKISDDVNMDDWAKMTIGFSGAALAMLMNESAINAVNSGRDVICTEDIDEAYYKAVMKGSKKKRGEDSDKDEVKLVAYHEAGHALAARLLTNNDVPRVTIIPSTNGAGGVTFNIPKKVGLLSKKEFLANIQVLYAGRAAEELLMGDPNLVTTGASSDIERATSYIKSYFEDFGFSEEFGMIQLSQMSDARLYAEEAKMLSRELYDDTKKLLLRDWDTLKRIAETLIEKETLTGYDLARLME